MIDDIIIFMLIKVENPYILFQINKGLIIKQDAIPKSSYSTNISNEDATTNLCKSVKSVSFHISRHVLTPIYTDFT